MNRDDDVLVRIGSRRAARALERLLGYSAPEFKQWGTPRYFKLVPAARIEECIAITGISRVGKVPSDLIGQGV